MELKLFRHLWGLDEPWETAFPKIKAAGYAGIESGLPKPDDETRFRELLAAHRFDYIAQIFTTGGDVQAHLASFRGQFARAASFDPVLVNCHGGRDAWTTGESQQFYDAVLAVERQAPLPSRMKPTGAASCTTRGSRVTCCTASPISSSVAISATGCASASGC